MPKLQIPHVRIVFDLAREFPNPSRAPDAFSTLTAWHGQPGEFVDRLTYTRRGKFLDLEATIYVVPTAADLDQAAVEFALLLVAKARRRGLRPGRLGVTVHELEDGDLLEAAAIVQNAAEPVMVTSGTAPFGAGV